MKKKTVKAWAVIGEHGLLYQKVFAVNSKDGAGLSYPAIHTTKIHALNDQSSLDGEKVVSCTITYEI